MAYMHHTYGPSCHLARSVSFGEIEDGDDIPQLKPQYFFRSDPIDDLSVVPTTAGSDSKGSKHPLRPFSASDNFALEEAWLDFSSPKSKKKDKKQDKKRPSRPGDKTNTDDLTGNLPESAKSVEKDKNIKQAATLSAGLPVDILDSKQNDKNSKLTPEGESSKTTAETSAGKEDRHSRRHARAEAALGKIKRRVSTSPRKQIRESRDRRYGKEAEGSTGRKADVKGTIHNSDIDEGNANNTGCDDTRQIDLDAANSTCCGILEADGRLEHHDCVNPRSDASGTAQHPISAQHSMSDCQRDGTVENLAAQQGTDVSEQKTKEYRLFEKHEESKAHKEYEKHLHQEHGGRHATLSTEDQNSKIDESVNEPRSLSPALLFRAKGKRAEILPDSKKDKLTKPAPSESPASSPKAKERSEVESLLKKHKSKQGLRPDSPVPITTGRGKKDAVTPSSSPGAISYPSQSEEAGTTGQPFLKFESNNDQTPQIARDPTSAGAEVLDDQKNVHRTEDDEFTQSEPVEIAGCKAKKALKGETDVPVGVSRLHLVKIPALQMHPIYWSPVHDIAVVTRGTWFYKQTMYPVEPAVANQLESGYRELRPWSKTWNDELNSAMDVGAVGEEKIVYQLWPKDEVLKKAPSKKAEKHVSTNPYCAAKCFHGETAAEGTIDSEANTDKSNIITKKYSSAQVIYKDARNAYILKPTLQPSAYYGRKPLQKINKGIQVGIHVVRGFEWASWHKLHSTKKPANVKKAVEKAAVSGDANFTKGSACPACQLDNDRPKVTDLCLVVHGIGQKLSERVESFHFTHAINTVRRSVNMELVDEGVKRVLRPDLGSIMVLPVNWRSNLSFEAGGSMTSQDQENNTSAEFTMKDITPDSIAGVRSLISDVMLDIPMYMSHHKPKMIQAVVSEANRVYRLWCKNNPGFHEEGRVHLIAHSLGSAMAVDILSKQPTATPKLDLNSRKINAKHFDFKCTNLFLAGSPSLSKAMRYITPGVSASDDLAVGEVSKPAPILRLPSQLELEIHDFTREELAEKKFALLNDNGQVDWFLSSGGGPLEIQYITTGVWTGAWKASYTSEYEGKEGWA
ncbi:putative phospholipase [Glarea lozoyensis 74030]|uniref:Putative phospholipase n=1 Tax=Glarea lozoyensis (strain ATCC 74030 / MF5533) TaxID=1104152 RepID=H0EV04_GLAL7|nr:putative phospholipase [Glarea lozoyensis 74030]